MNQYERKLILEHIKEVDYVLLSIDEDRSVCESLQIIPLVFTNHANKFIFANGGDVNSESDIPEKAICDKLKFEMVFGLGDKIQSSRWLKEQKEN